MAGDKNNAEAVDKKAAAQVKAMRLAVMQGLDGIIAEMTAAFAIKDRGQRTVAIQDAKAALNKLREGLE